MKPIVLSFVLVSFSMAAQAGVTVKTVDGDGEASVLSVEGNKLRVEGKKQLLIFDGDKKEMINVDPAKRTYSVHTEAEMKKAGAGMKTQMDKQMAEMRKRMASMPPDQRAQMEEMMKKMPSGRGAPAGGAPGRGPAADPPKKASYVRLGEKKQIAGHSCEMYRVMRGKDHEETTCFIPWSDGVVKKDDLKAFDALSSFMDSMTQSMGVTAGDDQGDWSHGMRDAPGIPARSVDSDGKVTMELKSIERGSVDKAKFAPPSDYAKVNKPMFGE